GSQYGSDDWQRFCRANNLVPSMSRRGNCWDTHSNILSNTGSD
ncbi:transposase family protein, partial [Citrobacter freundii]|nr:transposase family protein [Escherichia coli]MBD9993011.1 transposase family protein [Citrobacter freundii]EFJ8927890.1 transposase family protein [Escherichia coli]EFL0496590.1 transposase family protein [Escherichia coli]EFL9436625.1 transposase family protein [Escherichia coli]